MQIGREKEIERDLERCVTTGNKREWIGAKDKHIEAGRGELKSMRM